MDTDSPKARLPSSNLYRRKKDMNTQVMNLSDVEKLEKAIDYAIPHLGPQARDQLKQFITPESLAIVAGVWGDILISSRGSMVDRRLALIHEKVHRLLTPKFFLLRNFRVSNRASSYSRSPLSVYIEEALAETVAQVGVNGFRSVFEGITFPVKNGYVSLIRVGVVAGERISPCLPEVGGLIGSGFIFQGMSLNIYYSVTKPKKLVNKR